MSPAALLSRRTSSVLGGRELHGLDYLRKEIRGILGVSGCLERWAPHLQQRAGRGP